MNRDCFRDRVGYGASPVVDSCPASATAAWIDFQELDVGWDIVDDQNARSHELYLRIAQKVADGLDEFAD